MQQLYIIAAILATSQLFVAESADLYDKSPRGKGYSKRGCCEPGSYYGSYGGSCAGGYDLGESYKHCGSCDSYPTCTYGGGYGSLGSSYGSCGYDTCGSGCGPCKTRCVSCGTGYGSCGPDYGTCGTGYGSRGTCSCCGTGYGSCGSGYSSCGTSYGSLGGYSSCGTGTGCGSCGPKYGTGYGSYDTGYGSCGTGYVTCGTGCSTCGSYPVYSSSCGGHCANPCDGTCSGSYTSSCPGTCRGSLGGYSCRSYGGYGSGDVCGCGSPAVCHYLPSPRIKQVVVQKYDRGNGYTGRNDACYPSSYTYCAPNFRNLVASGGRGTSQQYQFGYELCPLTPIIYRDELCPLQFDSSYIGGNSFPVTHQSLSPLMNCRSLRLCDQGQFPQLPECYSPNFCTKWQTCNTFPESNLNHYNYFTEPNPSLMYYNHVQHNNNTRNVHNSNIHKAKSFDATPKLYQNNNVLNLPKENTKGYSNKPSPRPNKKYPQNDMQQNLGSNYRRPQSQFDVVTNNHCNYDQHSTEYSSQRSNDYYQGEHRHPQSNYENSPEFEWAAADGNENQGDDRGYNERAIERNDRGYNERANERNDRGYNERTNERNDRGYNERTNERNDRGYNERTNERNDRGYSDPNRDTSENRYYNRFSHFKTQHYPNEDHYDEYNDDNGHVSDYNDSEANYDCNN